MTHMKDLQTWKKDEAPRPQINEIRIEAQCLAFLARQSTRQICHILNKGHFTRLQTLLHIYYHVADLAPPV